MCVPSIVLTSVQHAVAIINVSSLFLDLFLPLGLLIADPVDDVTAHRVHLGRHGCPATSGRPAPSPAFVGLVVVRVRLVPLLPVAAQSPAPFVVEDGVQTLKEYHVNDEDADDPNDDDNDDPHDGQ